MSTAINFHREPVLMTTDDPIGTLMLDAEFGMLFYVTDCCAASAKGGEFGIVCRKCYQPIPFEQADAWMLDDDAGWARYERHLGADLVATIRDLAQTTMTEARGR